MTKKIAVVIIHGVGERNPEGPGKMKSELESRCKKICKKDIVIRTVDWADILQSQEDELWKRLRRGKPMDFTKLREFVINFLADALFYQETLHDREAYNAIHRVFAKTVMELAKVTGGEAPLFVIAHSLGSVIASNYIYDLQKPKLIPKTVRDCMGKTPLDLGETLTSLYTLGSPLALWSLRYKDFGEPIKVPSWINFYDRDDVVAFPLEQLNPAYGKVVKDEEVNVGGIAVSWTPFSHYHYWADKDVVGPISKALIRSWKKANK